MQVVLRSTLFAILLITIALFTPHPTTHMILLLIGGVVLISSIVLSSIHKQRTSLVLGVLVILILGSLLVYGPNRAYGGLLNGQDSSNREAPEERYMNLENKIPERFEIGRTLWSARNGELGLESDILIFDATGGTYEYTASVYEGELELCTHSDQRTLVGANDGPTAVLVRIPCGSIEGDVLTVTFTDGENTISETLVLE
jgi:hypothetical protein